MTLQEAIKDWRIVVGTVTALAAGGGAVGYQFDRPAWASELNAVINQVQQNADVVRQMQIDIIQRRIWAQEDRQDMRPTEDGKLRLRELRKQLELLEAPLTSKD